MGTSAAASPATGLADLRAASTSGRATAQIRPARHVARRMLHAALCRFDSFAPGDTAAPQACNGGVTAEYPTAAPAARSDVAHAGPSGVSAAKHEIPIAVGHQEGYFTGCSTRTWVAAQRPTERDGEERHGMRCRAVPCLPDAFGWFRSRRFGPRMAGLCGSRSARKASSYESITQPHTLLPSLQGPISPTHSERMRSEAHSSQATTACGATHLSTLTHTRARTRTSTHTRARTQRALPTGRTRACARSPLLQVLRADGRALVAAARADLGGAYH